MALTTSSGKGGMLALNITTVIQAVSYGVFLVLMNEILFQPMLKHLDQRRGIIQKAEEAAEKAEETVRRVKRERDEKLAEAFRQAGHEKMKIKAQGVLKYQEVIHKARSDSDARLDQAREDLEQEVATAEKELQGQLGDLTGLIQKKLLGEEEKA
jgi:F0F1-type ATP synthase membrane subunit b/b'